MAQITPDSAVKRQQDGSSLHLAPTGGAVGTPLSVPTDAVAYTGAGAQVGTPLNAAPSPSVGTPLNVGGGASVGTPLHGPAPTPTATAWNQTAYEIQHQAYLDSEWSAAFFAERSRSEQGESQSVARGAGGVDDGETRPAASCPM